MSHRVPLRGANADLKVAGGAKAREMAVLRSRFKIEGFWKIEEPEIAREFEGRDFAFFDVQPTGGVQGHPPCQR